MKHKFELLGNRLPQGKVLFCSADSKYFLRFAPAFVQSCIDLNQKLHIHIINRTDEAFKLQNMIFFITKIGFIKMAMNFF